MIGHVQIDGHEYMLVKDGKDWRQATPTPMAAKQTNGTSEYSDMNDRDAWDMQNWEAGLGRREADSGGFDFALAETRYPGRITLPRELQFARIGHNGNPTNMFQPGDVDTVTPLRSAEGDKVAVEIIPVRSGFVRRAWVYLDLDSGVTVDVSFYKDDDYPYEPTTSQETVTVTGDGAGPHWYEVEWLESGVDPAIGSGTYAYANRQYWIVIENASADIRLPAYSGLYSTNSGHYFYDGNIASWALDDNVAAFAIPQGECFGGMYNGDSPQLVHFEGNVLAVVAGGIFRWAGNTQNWVEWATFSSAAYDVEVWGGYLWIAGGSTLKRIGYNSTSGTVTVTSYSVQATTVSAWRGYLYRGYQNDLYYTGDPDSPTWSGPLEIGPDGYEIRGMAGLDANDLYISTDYALFVYTDTGLIESPLRWPVVDEGNGVGMVHHQGVLYIPIGQTVYQYDGSGSLLPMGPDREEGLPAEYAGDVSFMYSTNQWLFCAVNGTSKDAIFAWNGQGWHLVADMPQGLDPLSMVYSPTDKYLYISAVGEVLRMYQPDRVQLPEKDSDTRYAPYGRIDFPWFYGGMRRINKVFYLILIDGQNISSASYVKVWWQDQDSTGWEYLGTITEAGSHVYWSVGSYPSTKKFRIRLTLHTEDNATAPVIEAVVAEYQAMVRDRYQWRLPILVTEQQELFDGEMNRRTVNQMIQHLDGLRTANAPFDFVDVDGQRWTVLWKSQSAQLERLEFDRPAKQRRIGKVYLVELDELVTD